MYRIPVDPVASPNDQATLRRSGPGVLDLAQAMAAMGVWLLDPMVESSKAEAMAHHGPL